MEQEKNKKQENTTDIFLSNMSHELRTPINTILGLNEMILRESQEETVKEYARDIRQAGNILLALVSDILDFSKLETDKMELTEGIYDVSSLLNDLINSISVQQRRKKLDLVLDIAQDIPYKLLGDEIHIRQIIGNLLSNAVRYTDKGKVTLHLSWKEVSEDVIEICVIVKDTGKGIRKEDIPNLFTSGDFRANAFHTTMVCIVFLTSVCGGSHLYHFYCRGFRGMVTGQIQKEPKGRNHDRHVTAVCPQFTMLSFLRLIKWS